MQMPGTVPGGGWAFLELTDALHYKVPQTEVTLGRACHKVHKLAKIVINVDLSRTKYSAAIFPRIFKRIERLHYKATAN